MIACGPHGNAARAGNIGPDNAADGRFAQSAVEYAMVHRLERQHLVFVAKHIGDVAQMRAGTGSKNHFGWLVEGDARQMRQRQVRCGLHRAAESGAGVAAGNRQWGFGGPRGGDNGGGFGLGGGGVDCGHCSGGFPGGRNLVFP